jgi:transposase
MPNYVSEELKAEAQALRDAGKSYRHITATLNIPKSTLSHWWGKGVADKAKKRIKDRRKDRDRYIQEYKEKHGCQDCRNEGYPGMHPYYVLDADHVTDEKVVNISRASRTMSLELIKEELDKCDIVCANHHRIRTYKREQFKKELKATEE